MLLGMNLRVICRAQRNVLSVRPNDGFRFTDCRFEEAIKERACDSVGAGKDGRWRGKGRAVEGVRLASRWMSAGTTQKVDFLGFRI